MSSTAALQRRIDHLIAQIDRARVPKTWLFLLEAGREIPAHVRLLFGPCDQVVIREYPAGFLDEDTPEGYKLIWTK